MNLSKTNIVRNLSNFIGKTVNKKVLVIESDDWGSIRMPSLGVYEKLKNKGFQIDNGDAKRYNNFDTLASNQDLEALFETFKSIKNANNQNPKLTAVSLVANPDFDKIKEHNFEEYFFEPFTETLKRYNLESAIKLWKEGKSNDLFCPQFHGREHLNISTWMRALKAQDTKTLEAFENGLWAFKHDLSHGVSYQAAFDLEYASDLTLQGKVIESGLHLFQEIHGFKATFFVPPNGPFNNTLELYAANAGVKYMSTSKIQKEVFGEGKTRTKFHYLGQKNSINQTYITRNCFFEPSSPGKDWVASCLNEIEIAFKWNKPAVISSHRVNYIGGLVENNRKNGLLQLKNLLTKVVNKWPDVTFMYSHELGDLLTENNK